MSAYLERTRRLPNVPLIISVCERMRVYEHTLAYADVIRCNVTELCVDVYIVHHLNTLITQKCQRNTTVLKQLDRIRKVQK